MADEEKQSGDGESKLTESMILAPSFVPKELRQINFLPITTSLSTKRMENRAVFHYLYGSMVTPVPGRAPLPPCRVLVNPKKDFACTVETHFRLRPDFECSLRSVDDARGQNDYIQILASLMNEERDETLMLYERYSQYASKINAIIPRDAPQNAPQNLSATLDVSGIHNARPPLQPGDTLILRPHRTVHMGKTFETRNGIQPLEDRVEIYSDLICTQRGAFNSKLGTTTSDKVLLTWLQPSALAQALKNTNFTVRFLPSPTNHERCLTAMKWLANLNPLIAKEILFPSKAPLLPKSTESCIDLSQERLNDKQALFVEMVLTRTKYPSVGQVRPPMILTGPAGTGKTRALEVAILNTLQVNVGGNTGPKKRVLVCTPSHTAADVVARRLGMHLSSGQLFRLYDSTRPAEMVPTYMLKFARQGLNGEFIMPRKEEFMNFQVIVCTCSDAHLLYMAGLTNSSLRSRRQILSDWMKKTLEGNNMKLEGSLSGAEETHFTHLFIDEAAQATESESLIPFSVVVDDAPGVVKVEIALVGDPRQLSPDVYSPHAAEKLQISMLERLLRLPVEALGGGRDHLMGPPTEHTWNDLGELIEYSFQRKDDHENLSVFLTLSYRGHPSFLIMPSQLFYFGKLRSALPLDETVNSKWCSALRKIEAMSSIANPNCDKKDSWPIHFRGVIGRDASEAVESFWGSNSWSNPQEANEILRIVQKLVLEAKVSTMEIGIMAAFRAQVVLIRKVLRENNLGAINVGMVEDFQAVEKEVTILSLTRSNEVLLAEDARRQSGLYKQPKRINVALTRAEHMLIVVGNPNTMASDGTWREWLKFCHDNGLWYGARMSVEEVLS